MKSQFYQGALTIYPPLTHCHDNYSSHFSDFSSNQVTLPTDPPVSYCSNVIT